MKKLLSIIVAGSIFILASCTINKPAEQVRTITVTGTGTVSVEPDLVSLQFLVRTSDWNVSKACEKNAVNSTNVINAVKNAGVDSTDIITSDYRILQDNSKNYPGEYTVYNTISVLIRNTEITGSVIDAAVKNNTGANGLTSFSYSVSDTTTALRQARTQAVQNAQDAAALIAGASGNKVDTVLDIKEKGFSQNSGATLRASALNNDIPVTPIQAGTVNISTSVIITYSLTN